MPAFGLRILKARNQNTSNDTTELQDMSPSAGSEQPPTPMNPLMTDFADLSLQKKRKVPKGARMMRQQMQQRQRTRATCRNPEPPKEKEKEEGMGSDEESITRISLHQEWMTAHFFYFCLPYNFLW